MAVDGGVEISGGVDLGDQFADDGGAGAALIAGVAGQHRLTVAVAGGEGHHIAVLVIVHLDLRVHAEQYGAYRCGGGLRRGGDGLRGGAGGLGGARVTAAGGESGEGQRGGEGQGHKPEIAGSFHVVHLL